MLWRLASVAFVCAALWCVSAFPQSNILGGGVVGDVKVSSSGSPMTTPIMSGMQSAPSASVQNFAPLIAASTGAYTAGAREYPIPIAGTFSNLSVNFVTSASPGTYAVALTKNGSTTSTPNCTVSTNACSDASTSISVAAGDLVGYSVTPSSSPSTSTNTQFGIEFVSTNNNESFLVGGSYVATPSTGANNWTAIQGAGAWVATNDLVVSNVMPAAGVIDHLYVVGSAAPGAAKSYTITVNRNGSAAGSPGNLSCQLTGTGSGAGITTCNDLTDSITVAQGDTISIESTPAGTPATDAIRWGVRWKPTTAGQSLLLMSSSSAPGTTATAFSYPNGTASAGASETSNEVLSPALGGSGFSITSMYVAFSAAPTTGTRTVTLRKGGSSTTMLCALSLSATGVCTPTAVSGVSTATLFDWQQVSAAATATTSYKVGAVMTVP